MIWQQDKTKNPKTVKELRHTSSSSFSLQGRITSWFLVHRCRHPARSWRYWGLHNYSSRASAMFLGQWDCGSMGQWSLCPIQATPRDPDSHVTVLKTSVVSSSESMLQREREEKARKWERHRKEEEERGMMKKRRNKKPFIYLYICVQLNAKLLAVDILMSRIIAHFPVLTYFFTIVIMRIFRFWNFLPTPIANFPFVSDSLHYQDYLHFFFDSTISHITI